MVRKLLREFWLPSNDRTAFYKSHWFVPAPISAYSRSSDTFPYNTEFPEGPPTPTPQKMQINSVLPALYSIFPGFWETSAPLRVSDPPDHKTKKPTAAQLSFPVQGSSLLVYTFIDRGWRWREAKRREGEETGEQTLHWHMFKKQLEGREPLQAAGVFSHVSLSSSSPLHNTPHPPHPKAPSSVGWE